MENKDILIKAQEYIKEIRMQILKDEEKTPESTQSLNRLAELEKLDKTKLTKSAMELLRPATLDEVVGQERAVEALRAKLASPYPQHLILYGPPGVGKTTAARLVLEEARKAKFTPFAENAPFVETDGTTLRWDPRDMTNPLLGSVHDPIYQGARRDLADTGIPEPKTGLVTEAHGGILFIDEIGEMDPMLQNKLLKVLEDKRVFFDSTYYDANDENVPKYIKKLFEEGAPADFVMIGATTREPEDINAAIRSRCAEIYFEPLTPKHIQEIVKNAASKLNVAIDEAVPKIISDYTIEGRKAINILADAYSLALYRNGDNAENIVIDKNDILSENKTILDLLKSINIKYFVEIENDIYGRSNFILIKEDKSIILSRIRIRFFSDMIQDYEKFKSLQSDFRKVIYDTLSDIYSNRGMMIFKSQPIKIKDYLKDNFQKDKIIEILNSKKEIDYINKF